MASNPITARINALILSEMAARGITRAEMARRLECSPVTVTKALNDPARDWGVSTLAAWVEAMGGELAVEVRAALQEEVAHA